MCARIWLLLGWCCGLLQAGDLPSQVAANQHKMLLIPAGSYAIGAENHPANPAREVKLASFWIAEAETTNAQFTAFVNATHYVTDAEKRGFGQVFTEGMADWAWNSVKGANWKFPLGPDGPAAADLPQHPVTQISGADAEAYCKWAELRLPTLTEWEAAARAGAKTKFPWGDTYSAKQANTWDGKSHRKNLLTDGFRYTSPVKSFPPNAWGLYDVIGNVFEYCQGIPATLMTRAGQERRIMSGRGGSWWCSEDTCSYFNLVDIGTMDKHGSLANQGFRVAKDGKK